MSTIKRLRPSQIVLYFACFASVLNCVFICAVIFSHRAQNRKFSDFLSKIPAREVQPVEVASSSNALSRLPSLLRFQDPSQIQTGSARDPDFSPSPYAVVRPPRPGSDLAQVITHEGEMLYVRYSELPPAWRKPK